MSKIPQRWDENFAGHDYELQANKRLSCEDSLWLPVILLKYDSTRVVPKVMSNNFL